MVGTEIKMSKTCLSGLAEIASLESFLYTFYNKGQKILFRSLGENFLLAFHWFIFSRRKG